VAQRLANAGKDTLFFAGCSEEQAQFGWDLKVLLTAPEEVIVQRLANRATNRYGKSVAERERVLGDLRDVEPRLRLSADVVIDTTQPLARVADRVLAVAARPRRL
jgi:hypothetical protein